MHAYTIIGYNQTAMMKARKKNMYVCICEETAEYTLVTPSEVVAVCKHYAM